MSHTIAIAPLTAEAFAPYGDVIEASGAPDMMINQGMCGRFHDRASLDLNDEEGRTGISVFKATARTLPYALDLMERHPLGSQAFVPMTADPFLVIVASDLNGRPHEPQAFLTDPGQGVNYHRGTWHGVLTPLHEPGLFAVIDRIGPGENLEEHWFEEPIEITRTGK
ncbi:MAG: ureidoglycolate lyase [Rhodospirillaceae bacterium]|jgi:ureidoglycolate lyase|nr:ureidoglycolate lyase [Rhodospirillaceae bacterium]MBT5943514.1 ureidoglycolate lyase [Rhodospirillaceae bacterium]MBT6404928.1 ureidoglycolate lyase [Rhodospirillaceae bacterium]MBT6537502.1 ureidoglycolate lyase [Rhodospirillaceae bacterium]